MLILKNTCWQAKQSNRDFDFNFNNDLNLFFHDFDLWFKLQFKPILENDLISSKI